METEKVSVRVVKRVLDTRNLDLYLVIMMALQAYALVNIQSVYDGIQWYISFILTAIVFSLVVSHLKDEKRFFLKLLDYSISNVPIPAVLWGAGVFFILLFAYMTTGASFTWGNLDIMIHQLFVASAETMIFCIFLPEAYPKYWGRIPFKFKFKVGGKVIKGYQRIPGWFWAAGVWFALFHFSAYYTGDLYQMMARMLVATFFGLGWYKLYKFGEKNRFLGGAPAVIASHWSWNYIAIAVVAIVIPELLYVFFPM